MSDHVTHYVGDDCPGGHADVADQLGLIEVLPGVWAPAFCACGNRMPCRHC